MHEKADVEILASRVGTTREEAAFAQVIGLSEREMKSDHSFDEPERKAKLEDRIRKIYEHQQEKKLKMTRTRT